MIIYPSARGILTVSPTPVGGTDPIVTDWVARTVAEGGTVAAGTVAAMNTFVTGCKSDGIWNTLSTGLLLPFASDSFGGAFVPLVMPPNRTLNSSLMSGANYALNTGINPGTGTHTRYITSNIVPDDVSLADSLQISAYVNQMTAASNNATVSWETSASSRIFLAFRRTTLSFFDAYQSNVRLAFGDGSTPIGFYSLTRSSTHGVAYYNGALLASRVYSTGGYPSSATLNIFRFGGAAAGDQSRYGYLYAGQMLTAPQEALHYARVQALQTALGRAV